MLFYYPLWGVGSDRGADDLVHIAFLQYHILRPYFNNRSILGVAFSVPFKNVKGNTPYIKQEASERNWVIQESYHRRIETSLCTTKE
jgi:hypothetical protein